MIGLAVSSAKLTRTWKLGAASVTLILLFVAFAVIDSQVVSAAPSPLVNESFETGDFGGWAVYVPSHGFAGAVTSFTQSLPAEFGYPAKDVTCTAKEGTYYALLKTNGAGSYTDLPPPKLVQE